MDNPILRHVNEQLETPRLILRCPQPGDGQVVYEGVKESQADLRKYLAWAQAEPTPQAYEVFCREKQAEFLRRNVLTYLVFLKDTGMFVGSSSLHAIDWTVPKFEIGYWCRSSLHRNGYATETAQALAAYAFLVLGAQRVALRVDARNAGSRGVCERVGFPLEGIIRNDKVGPDGELRDTRVYADIRFDASRDALMAPQLSRLPG